MKIVSWNVNGLKSITKKGKLDEVLKYDAILLQETRTEEIPQDLLSKGFTVISFPAKRKGYSGVMTILKTQPKNVFKGIGITEFDDEGRVITVELDKFYLINAYFPRAGDGLSRLDFKLSFDNEFEKFMDALRKEKPVIACGDFNAVTDLKKDSTTWNERLPGLSPKEREWVNNILQKGYVDAFRLLYPDKIEYTWRSYRHEGTMMRLDYCIVSEELKSKVKDFQILKIEGSDHYPIRLEIEI